MLGASCFALGTIPAYVHAVGAVADAMTFFVGSIFFTSASYCQLVQAQSPGMTDVDQERQHTRVRRCRGPGGRATRTGWRRPRSSPGRFSSTSARSRRPRSTSPRRRPTGTSGGPTSSAPFCFSWPARSRYRPGGRVPASAVASPALVYRVDQHAGLGGLYGVGLASFVLPQADKLMIDVPLANAATFLGAVCFLVAAALCCPPGGPRCGRDRPS